MSTIAARTSAYREAMSELASGVVLVTCSVGGRPWGMTVTAFQLISAEPPVVLVSLDSGTRTARAVQAQRRFGISILAERHAELARSCARPGAAKYLDSFEVDDALAELDCEVIDTVRIADHVVFLGRVRDVRVVGDEPALVYHRRAFRAV